MRQRGKVADLIAVVIDCQDPERLAAFWHAVLGVDEDVRLGDRPQYIDMKPTKAGGPAVVFQQVPEAKTGKNRLHLDLFVDDLDAAASKVEGLGGNRLPQADFHEYGWTWRIMADPEDNEFCLILRR